MKKVLLVAVLFCAMITKINAQDSKPILTQETALKIQEAAMAYAIANDLKVAIAVFDAHARLITFVRMDGTSIGVSKLARWKGLSAASYERFTSNTATWNIDTAPNIATAEGGVPIFTKEGIPLGGVGVSGAVSADDVKIGEAGLKAVGLYSVVPEE